MSDTILSFKQTIDFAKKHGYISTHSSELLEMIMIREWLRTKHKIYVTNDQDERGSSNHKTSEYFTCTVSRREPHPSQKGKRYINKQHYQTFSKYEEALCFGLIWGIEKMGGKGSLQNFLDTLK